jgi:tetratricopeptide (TPR) repeat protein
MNLHTLSAVKAVRDGARSQLVALAAALVTALVAPCAQATPYCEGKVVSDTLEEQQEITLALLRGKKLDALQRRMDGHLDAYGAGRSSDEELFYEFGAFDRWGPFLTPLIEEWIALRPKSFAARHAMTLHLAAVAWQKRGERLARETSKQQFGEFDKALAAAQDSAIRSIALHPKPILAYQALMVTGKAMRFDPSRLGQPPAKEARSAKVPRPDLLPILSEAERVQPDNTIVRVAYVRALAPRWSGSLEALQDYAKPATHARSMSADRVARVVYEATTEIASDNWFRGRLDEAADSYAVAARMCNLARPWLDIANIRMDQKRPAEALLAADAYLEREPGSIFGRALRMRALRPLGRHKDVVELARALSPEGVPEATYVLGEYHLSGEGGVARNPAEARRLISEAARSGYEPAIERLATLK